MGRKKAVDTAVLEPSQPAAGRQGITKAQAIARALKALGNGARSADLIGYARQKFDVDVSPNYVSIIKSDLKKKRTQVTKLGRDELGAVNGQANSGRASEEPTAAADIVTLVREVKALARKAGGMPVLKRLVEAIAE